MAKKAKKVAKKTNGKPVFGSDHAQKITSIEALRFHGLDLEIRNFLQGAKILELEIKEAEIQHQQAQHSRQVQRKTLLNAVEKKRKSYTQFVEDLAGKHGLDPKHISIDEESRIIRDLRQG